MDKYEFNIKVEQIKKLVNKSDYETAMKIADTIDWKRVRNTNLLSMVASVYEKNEEYQESKDILLLAFERAPIGKRLLYKLAELALKEGNVEEAEDYYREFCDLAPEDPRQNLLRYLILKAKGAPAQQLIHSLESYTSIELDEKWLYELADLYNQAGMELECVNTCDKIMLMFGLGKYVDKAMELKIQYAPLTSYQMDLVENRDKYEAKLRAVEEQFGTVKTLSEDEYEEDEDDEEIQEDMDEDMEDVMPHSSMNEDLVAKMREAEAEERLAKELSRMSVEDFDEEPSSLGQTRILDDIKSFKAMAGAAASMSAAAVQNDIETADEEEPEYDPEPVIEEDPEPLEDDEEITYNYNEEESYEEAPIEELEETLIEEDPEIETVIKNHLMIEARTADQGLKMAIEALKQIHRETGTKNPVAKIAGEKLSNRGVLACADKLAGKDLIVEEAGDLSDEALDELNELINQDDSGMIVVLIDNPKQMEALHSNHPTLASKFECIGSRENSVAPIMETVERAVAEQAEVQETIAKEVIINKEPVKKPKKSPKPAVPIIEPEEDDEEPVVQQRPASRVRPQVIAEPEQEEADIEEMGIDEFAQYACKYANEIDCSITGKSMLALYERIEIMEEDGISLTKRNAEDLIEEAADKAEKPTIGKLITGVFSSKYDKEGLLVLKEEHFIN